MRYAEKKAVRLMNNGLNNEMDTGKLNRREKRDRELLKTKTDNGLDKTEKTQETMPNEDDKTAGSPLSKPTNPHPDPKRK